MTKFLSGYYYSLEETLTRMNSLKLKSYPGKNVTDWCAEILIDAERLENSRGLDPDHLGYITRIFGDNSDSRFCLWYIRKYKEVAEFIKKIRVCDMDVIS